MRVVIIGNGVAGVTAGRRIRELDAACEIEIFTRERFPYYYRPRLPEIVAGEIDVAGAIVFPPSWYESRGLTLNVSTAVVSVDTGTRSVVLVDGRAVRYDRLLIATGADPFVPPIPGAGRRGSFTLRTADDAMAIRDWARRATRAVVIGGGLLGLEAARGLRATGLDVTVLEGADRLLPRQLDPRAARLLESEIEKLGMKVVKGAATTEIAGGENVQEVVLAGGDRLPCDVVLISTGVRCSAGFLAGSGIEIKQGVVVNCDMETNAPGVYAAGDVGEFEGRSWGIIPVALAQAEAAARSITGDRSEKNCRVAPSNSLKITGIDVFSAGVQSCPDAACEEMVNEDAARGLYRKAVVKDGRILGAIVIGSKKGVKEIGIMIDRGIPVDRRGPSIVDEDFDFKGALAGAS
jgi:nitrite reductase (NADH) large subunit